MTGPQGPPPVLADETMEMPRLPSAQARTWPTVSAIVAASDSPERLAGTVRSVLGQNYPGEVECVVVFDQSAPVTLLVDVPARRGLRVMTNTRTPGLAGARNTGITASHGALIAFCDDSTVWTPDKLTLQVKQMKRTGAEFVASGVRIHHTDQSIERLPPAQVEFGQLVRERVTALHPSTFLMRRDALTGMGLVDERIPASYGEDYDWLLRAAKRMPIVSVEQPLVEVYWPEQSFFADRWAAIADALSYLLSKHPELKKDKRGMARIEGQIAFAQAALGHRRAAWRASTRALRGNPRERRAYLALIVASGLISAATIVRQANRRGRGI